MAAATVEVCYETQSHWFRCGNCDSLNIFNTIPKYGSGVRCPDCDEYQDFPAISLCSCGGVNSDATPLRQAFERFRERFIRLLRSF